MADHSKPTTTSTYVNFVSEIDGRLDDLALGLDPATTSPTNVPTNAIRWSSAANTWQKWNGSTWGNLSSSYVLGTGIFPAGAVGTPSITTTGDPNTGIFFPAADTIAFAEGGVEAMRIGSDGFVGIGTSSPAYKLDVVGSNPEFRLTESGGAYYAGFFANAVAGFSGVRYKGALAFLQESTERMRIDSSGNVGIGTSSPGQLLTVQNSASPIIRVGDGTRHVELRGGSTTQNPTIGTYYAGDFLFASNSTERMRITSAGEVLVGGTTTLPVYPGTARTPKSAVYEDGGVAVLGLARNDTTISSGDVFGGITFNGNDTTSNAYTCHAYVGAVASGTHAAGDNPTDLVFGCTNDGSETVAEFARLRQSGISSRQFYVTQPTLTDSQSCYVGAVAGTAGTVNRGAVTGVYKHSGITNSCGYFSTEAEDGIANYLWVDNSDILRISTTITNIGTTGGTVVGTQTSDERVKNIIGPVTYGLNEVLAISPVEYTFKDDVEATKKIGFIAQQVQPLVPESVYDTKETIVEGEPTKLGMEYVSLIPVLVNAIKELSAKNDALEARIAALEAK